MLPCQTNFHWLWRLDVNTKNDVRYDYEYFLRRKICLGETTSHKTQDQDSKKR